MKNWKTVTLFICYLLLLCSLGAVFYNVCADNCLEPSPYTIHLSPNDYEDASLDTILDQLKYRIALQPFNLVALIIFIMAIIHTFFAHKFTDLSLSLRKANKKKGLEYPDTFAVESLRFFGEVEVIFGIWVIPLLAAMSYYYDWRTAVQYLEKVSFVEPMFVVVIMTLSSTQPIITLAENGLRFLAKLGRESVQSWWWAILTIGPLSGSLITEPGAMTVSALLLSKQFYYLKPSQKLSYATLGLLFTNVSVGGVLTSFAAPPVLMVSTRWGWSSSFMVETFGWKAIIAIILANLLYFVIFKEEFSLLESKRKELEHKNHSKLKPIPFWISIIHISFLAWVVVHSHNPVIFMGGFLLFLGFHETTRPHQKELSLKAPILVGFFLAGLVIHGNLQGWWIAPMLQNVSDSKLLVLSAFLTSFNDNAEITFLASLIPDFDAALKYAVVAGAVTGGGLTVIANAPNPSGQAILSKHFYHGISAVSLFRAALPPTIIVGLCFFLLKAI